MRKNIGLSDEAVKALSIQAIENGTKHYKQHKIMSTGKLTMEHENLNLDKTANSDLGAVVCSCLQFSSVQSKYKHFFI